MDGFSDTNEFITHFNYIKCVNGMMTGVAVDVPLIKDVKIDLKQVRKQIKLANLTKNGIKNGVSACKSQAEYAEIVAPWIAVKCYYRIYYLESVLIHLATGSKFLGHSQVRRKINSYCNDKRIITKYGEAESLHTVGDGKSHKIKMGSNISKSYYMTPACVKSVRAKIANYCEDQWKYSNKIQTYSSKVNKEKRDKFRATQKISLFDYFYQMRLKANYKDMDFLKFDEINPSQTVEYVETYVSASNRYCLALQNAIKNIISVRGITI